MNDWDWLKPAATVLGAAAIVLVLVNAALVLRNESAQVFVNQRQQYINQGAAVNRVAQLLARTIARVAIETKDDALTALLERHGLQLKHTPEGDVDTAAPGATAPEETKP
jgi:hypothetical protein